MNKMKIFEYVWKKLCQFWFWYTKYKIQNTKYKIQIQNTKYNYGDDVR